MSKAILSEVRSYAYRKMALSPLSRWMGFNCAFHATIESYLPQRLISHLISLYVIPGSPFPLQRVYLGADNLLLTYADHRVRLWDVRTREFWRSMSLDKAEELVAQGGWTELYVYHVIDCFHLVAQFYPGLSHLAQISLWERYPSAPRALMLVSLCSIY